MVVNALLVFLVCLQLGDFYTTYKCCNGGGGYEWNPIVAFLMRQLGIAGGLLVAKGLAILLIVFYYYHQPSIPVLIGLSVVYTWVVYHNARIISA